MMNFNFEKKTKNSSSENEENINNIEIKKDKILDLEIDGKNYSLEYSSNDFEYSENTQKETGILGYERTVINEDQIKKLINYEVESSSNKEGIILKEILLKLSEGRFPSESFTYQMGLQDVHKNADSYLSQFKKDKFLLQDIFSVKSYFELEGNFDGASVFKAAPESDPDKSFFDVFDKKTKKILTYNTIDKIFKRFKDKIENNEVTIVSANGLNICDFTFFYQSNILDKSTVSFGFDRQDKLFQDYIDKSINHLRELNNTNKIEPIYLDNSSEANHDYQPRIYPNHIFLDLFGIKESRDSNSHLVPVDGNRNKWDFDFQRELAEKYGSAFSSKDSGDMMKSLSVILNEDGYYDEDSVFNREANKTHTFQNRSNFDIKKLWPNGIPHTIDNEPYRERSDSLTYHIPIFINDDKIKQIKWGHANYASFWTEKGFNFLKIKHMDNFPDKTEKI